MPFLRQRPVKCMLKTSTTITVLSNINKTEKRYRHLWNLCDSKLYQETLSEAMVPKIESPDQIKTYVDYVNKQILVASKAAIPSKQIRINGPKWKASPKLKYLLDEGHALHKLWIEYGRPKANHPIVDQRRSIKRKIRSQQRQEMAMERKHFYNEITQSSGTDKFFKLIRRGLSTCDKKPVIIRNEGQIISDIQGQCNKFARFYEDLSVPKQCEQFDIEYQENVSVNVELIRQIVKLQSDSIKPISQTEISEAISKLNSKKACDEFGISAEHLKLAGPSILPLLQSLFNAIVNNSYVPSQFLSGLITPVHKKGKDPTQCENYRGITVSCILSKTLEHIILNRITHLLPQTQSPLQFGFTKNTSILVSALLINESMVEASDLKIPLYIAFLDAQKAFDVVDHNSLKCKLFEEGINGKLWKLIDSWYSNLSSRVKWNGTISDLFPIGQGVRQGGILSTGLYKTYINELLLTLERHKLGTCIGDIYVGCPTVADDVALLANSPSELQSMLNVAYAYANREKYIIHPEKSCILKKVHPRKVSSVYSNWKLGDCEVTVSQSATHLGILRSCKNEIQVNIDDRITCAQKTLYALTGTGLHGINGLPPTTCIQLFTLYVLPRLLYGLEIFVLNQCQIDKLEKFHLKFLRHIQCLPTRSVIGATYLLLGVRPISAELHIRQLNLLASIIRGGNQSMINLIHRQYLTKNSSSKSWVIHVNSLLILYNLPNLDVLLLNVPSKLVWKSQVKLAVNKYWTSKLIADCEDKSTLKFCNYTTMKIGTVHPIWQSIQNNIKDVRRGGIIARLMTGTYILQTTTSKFNQYQISPLCPLCQIEEETVQHFLIKCNALFSYRNEPFHDLKCVITNISTDLWITLTNDLDLLTMLILDHIELVERGILHCSNDTLMVIVSISRKLCYGLHCGRTYIINSEMTTMLPYC